jgi:hypothetical protein
MQICQQIVNLLLIENLRISRHLVPPQPNNVHDPVVIRWHAAHGQILSLEYALHARALTSPRRVRRMAPVAIIVVDPAPGDLLRIESEFGVTLAPLNIAAGQRQQTDHRDTETQSNQF